MRFELCFILKMFKKNLKQSDEKEQIKQKHSVLCLF